MENISRESKLEALKLNKNIELPDEYINILYTMHSCKLLDNIQNNMQKNEDKKNDIKKIEIIKEPKQKKKKKNIIETDVNSPKYKTLLKLLNSILTNIGKPNIASIRDFQNIDRNDIIKKDNLEIFADTEDEIFKVFSKTVCGWYRRNLTKYYILTFIRYACKDINLKFAYKRKDIFENIKKEETKVRKTYLFYSIN